MALNLNYFYGSEAEQFSFYRIPKTLFANTAYKSVPVEAKVLYGLLLDRMALSARNGWMDNNGRVYIYFTMEQMNCGKDKAVKLFKALDTVSGIGLIERKKQGQGRPARIYVKNFVLPSEPDVPPEHSDPSGPPPYRDGRSSAAEIAEKQPVQDETFQTSEKQESALRHNSGCQTSEKPTLIRIILKGTILKSHLSILLLPQPDVHEPPRWIRIRWICTAT